MEEKKNTLKIVNIILAILLVISLGYSIYDKFISKTLPLKCPVCEEKECPTNETTECNCTSDKEKSDTKACNNEKCLVADIDYTEIFKDEKNFDGSYSSYYEISDNDELKGIYAYADIKMDGKVEFKIDGGNNQDGWYIIKNINNAIDIIFENGNAGLNNLYILCKNGDVYKYGIDDYENKIKTATKLNNLKDAIKFVIIKNCPIKNAGCSGNFGVVDKNMKYTNITTLY